MRKLIQVFLLNFIPILIFMLLFMTSSHYTSRLGILEGIEIAVKSVQPYEIVVSLGVAVIGAFTIVFFKDIKNNWSNRNVTEVLILSKKTMRKDAIMGRCSAVQVYYYDFVFKNEDNIKVCLKGTAAEYGFLQIDNMYRISYRDSQIIDIDAFL